MKYYCKECGREWDYPITNCIFCKGQIDKLCYGNYIIEDIIKVNIPTEDHPVVPYYSMLLKDSEGSYKFKKTFKQYCIGEKFNIISDHCSRYTIGIIGTGITGIGIAEVALRTGHKVILKSRSSYAIENAWSKLSKSFSKSMKLEESQVLLKNIEATTDYGPLARSDIIIESVIENFNVKKSIFKTLDSICDSNVIIASNTSSLSISQIATGLKYPERVIGLHFFNPITKLRLVEIIKGSNTSDIIADKCVELANHLNKIPILAKDTPGFVVNRLLFSMINEACLMLDQEISSIEDIDKAMKLGANYPMGPFELADLIGLDLCMEIIENLYDTQGTKESRPNRIMKELIEDGHLGRKSGKGFYEYW